MILSFLFWIGQLRCFSRILLDLASSMQQLPIKRIYKIDPIRDMGMMRNENRQKTERSCEKGYNLVGRKGLDRRG
jgi:hypothetical protein